MRHTMPGRPDWPIASRRGSGAGRTGERFLARDRAELTLDAIADAVLTLDRTGRVSYLNRAAEALTGWSRAQADGHPVEDLLRLLDPVTTTPVTPKPASAACLLIRPDGRQTEVEASSVPVRDREEQLTGTVVVLRDVGSALEVARQLFRRAHYDGLTGLPNRFLLEDRLREAVALSHRTRRRLAILFLDVDQFKEINDALGHAAGDQVLRSVATRMAGVLRKSDSVSRYGGDEFVALLPEIDRPGDADRVAGKLGRALGPPHVVASGAVTVTASVGIAICPDHGEDADTLLAAADVAMYAAKREAPGQYRFFDADLLSLLPGSAAPGARLPDLVEGPAEQES